MKAIQLHYSSSIIVLSILFSAILQYAEYITPSDNDGNFKYAASVLSASVKIKSTYEDIDGFSISRIGSGVIISHDGLIVTNYHNIYESQTISVSLYDGRKYEACLMRYNPRQDLAILQLNEKNLPFIPLAKPRQLEIGDGVYAVGNPRKLDFSLTSGIVGAFDRQIGVIKQVGAKERFIQTDVPINSGCSGGPLVNNQGELVGINTAISTQSGYFEGYSFAQPIEMVEILISESAEKQLPQRPLANQSDK